MEVIVPDYLLFRVAQRAALLGPGAGEAGDGGAAEAGSGLDNSWHPAPSGQVIPSQSPGLRMASEAWDAVATRRLLGNHCYSRPGHLPEGSGFSGAAPASCSLSQTS